MGIDIFEKAFESNGVKFSSVIRRLETELKWNTLIFELYKNRLSINLDDVNEQLESFNNKKKILHSFFTNKSSTRKTINKWDSLSQINLIVCIEKLLKVIS